MNHKSLTKSVVEPWVKSIDQWEEYVKARSMSNTTTTHLSPENQIVWKNIMEGMDEELRDSLERDLASPVFVGLR